MPAKRRTNLTIDEVLLDAAREFGLNVSAISEAALAQSVRECRERAWKQENAGAIADYNSFVDANGLPLSEFRKF